MKKIKILSGIFWILASSSAFSAKWADVVSSGADLFDGPRKGHNSIKKLPPGTPVQASNLPIEGYHKVRLKDGMLGWIKMEDLMIKERTK